MSSIKKMNREEALKLAQSSQSPNELEEIAKLYSEDIQIKYYLAMNPKTPCELLIEFSKNKERSIRIAVAQNPSTPLDTIKYMWLFDSCSDVRATAYARK